jgi:hypothetical protein
MVKRRIGLLPDAHRQGFGAIKASMGRNPLSPAHP